MPRNKYPEETVQKILETSLKLFTEKGYEQTTVLDIVANLGGLTRGAFYHHFKSKEEVLMAIFAENDGENHPFEQAQNAKVANGLERVKLALTNALKANIQDEKQTAISHLAVSFLSNLSNPRLLAEKIKGDMETATILAPFIQEGMEDGSIKPGNSKLLAELFMVLCNFWMMPTIFPCTPEEVVTKTLMVAEILEHLGMPVMDVEMGSVYNDVLDTLLDIQLPDWEE